VVAAATACVIETHLLAAEGVEGNHTILGYDANQGVCSVILFSESGLGEDDRHTSAICIEGDKSLNPTCKGLIYGGPIDDRQGVGCCNAKYDDDPMDETKGYVVVEAILDWEKAPGTWNDRWARHWQDWRGTFASQ
jgi:hypothetical protein